MGAATLAAHLVYHLLAQARELIHQLRTQLLELSFPHGRLCRDLKLTLKAV